LQIPSPEILESCKFNSGTSEQETAIPDKENPAKDIFAPRRAVLSVQHTVNQVFSAVTSL